LTPACCGMSEAAFQENERVLVVSKKFGGQLYEAKVQKVEFREGAHQYLIHYTGWSKKWDHFVTEPAILKWNDENLKRQKEVYDALMAAQQSYGKGARRAKREQLGPDGYIIPLPASSPVPLPATALQTAETKSASGKDEDSHSSGPSRNRKRKSESQDGASDANDKSELSLKIPRSLKNQLLEDWDQITNYHKLVPLPRDPTVSGILESYVSSKKRAISQSSEDEKIINDLVAGLKDYFDRALGTLLLYRFERAQYTQILKESSKKSMSEVYGAEHLLRLFAKLPSLLADVHMEESTLRLLSDRLHDFLKFLAKNQSLYFGTYKEADSDFLKFWKEQTGE